MNGESAYDPKNPAFLASRALDGELSADEQRWLDDALSESPELKREVKGLRQLDGLLRRWGEASIEIDWESHAALIDARLPEEPGEQGLQKADELLRRWGEPAPEIDEDRFVDAVMAQILPAARARRLRPLVFRLAAPLAAAAAVAVVLLAGIRSLVPRRPVLFVSFGPKVTGTMEDAGGAHLAVAVFDRSPKLESLRAASGGVSMMTMGASPEPEVEEVPPL